MKKLLNDPLAYVTEMLDGLYILKTNRSGVPVKPKA